MFLILAVISSLVEDGLESVVESIGHHSIYAKSKSSTRRGQGYCNGQRPLATASGTVTGSATLRGSATVKGSATTTEVMLECIEQDANMLECDRARVNIEAV